MAEARRDYITFASQAPGLDRETFLVVAVDGEEAVGRPYRFEVEVLSQVADLDFQAVLRAPATLGMKQGVVSSDGRRGLFTVERCGVLASFEQVGRVNEWTTYRAVLVPPFWKLGLTYQNRIFQNLTVPDMVAKILQDAGIPSDRFRFKPASRTYPVREYAVQYEETDLDFVHRWLEHEGIFYWFERIEGDVVTVFGDAYAHYLDLNEEISYKERRAAAGDEETESAFDWFETGYVSEFTCNRSWIPRTAILKDFNWRIPTESLEAECEISPQGEGIHYEYNNHFKNKAEGQELARIRAEEIRCREISVRGASTNRSFGAGMVFRLKDHYREDFNGRYFLTKVRHKATQDVALATNAVWRSTYGNTFEAIPAQPERPFRPPRTTPWPEIKGVLNAIVDGSSDATSAEVDPFGRYKVRLPLDRSEAAAGEASRYVRMAQPNAGPEAGFHFPLKPGVEVILTHVDGDPDRPIIAGAVPNPDTPSPVGSSNQMDSVIRTPAGAMAMHGESGHEQMTMQSGKSLIRFGSSSDPNYIFFDSNFVMDKTSWGKFALAGVVKNASTYFSNQWMVGFPQIQYLVNTALNMGLKYFNAEMQEELDAAKTASDKKKEELRQQYAKGQITLDKLMEDLKAAEPEPAYKSVGAGWIVMAVLGTAGIAAITKVYKFIIKKWIDSKLKKDDAQSAVFKDLKDPFSCVVTAEESKAWEVVTEIIDTLVAGAAMFIPYVTEGWDLIQVGLDLIKCARPTDEKIRLGNSCFSVTRKAGRATGATVVSTNHDGENVEFKTEIGSFRALAGADIAFKAYKAFRCWASNSLVLYSNASSIRLDYDVEKGSNVEFVESIAGLAESLITEQEEGMGALYRLDETEPLSAVAVSDKYAVLQGLRVLVLGGKNKKEGRLILEEGGAGVEATDADGAVYLATKLNRVVVDKDGVYIGNYDGKHPSVHVKASGEVLITGHGDVTISGKGITLKGKTIKLDSDVEITGGFKVGTDVEAPAKNKGKAPKSAKTKGLKFTDIIGSATLKKEFAKDSERLTQRAKILKALHEAAGQEKAGKDFGKHCSL